MAICIHSMEYPVMYCTVNLHSAVFVHSHTLAKCSKIGLGPVGLQRHVHCMQPYSIHK